MLNAGGLTKRQHVSGSFTQRGVSANELPTPQKSQREVDEEDGELKEVIKILNDQIVLKSKQIADAKLDFEK